MSQSDEHRPKISRFGTTDFVILGYRFPIFGFFTWCRQMEKGGKETPQQRWQSNRKKKGRQQLVGSYEKPETSFFPLEKLHSGVFHRTSQLK